MISGIPNVTVEWHDGEIIPPVKRGGATEYVVAVYRAHHGKVFTFSSSYLNAHPLNYKYECPKGDGCEGNGCDDGCPTTGWFYETGEDGDATQFNSLELKDGDKLMGWCEIPRWPGNQS